MAHQVVIPWQHGQTGFWWNETFSKVIDHFGLPGTKFTYNPEADKMTFYFIDEKDAFMCKILLSDRIA